MVKFMCEYIVYCNKSNSKWTNKYIYYYYYGKMQRHGYHSASCINKPVLTGCSYQV